VLQELAALLGSLGQERPKSQQERSQIFRRRALAHLQCRAFSLSCDIQFLDRSSLYCRCCSEQMLHTLLTCLHLGGACAPPPSHFQLSFFSNTDAYDTYTLSFPFASIFPQTQLPMTGVSRRFLDHLPVKGHGLISYR
jgi:hypothetical protein